MGGLGSRLLTTGVLVGLASALLLLPVGAASGSGYDRNYSRPPGSVSVPAVDLVSVVSSDAGGNNLTVSFSVRGIPDVSSSLYSYSVYMAGSFGSNVTATVVVSNNSTYGYLVAFPAGGGTRGFIPYHLSGSTVSVSVEKALVGSPVGFRVNVEATFADFTHNSSAFSWLGTDYPGANGGGTLCPPYATCPPTAGAFLGLGLLIFALLAVAAIAGVAVIVIVVVVVVRHSETSPPPPLSPPLGPWLPPPPPPSPPPPLR
jgi:hypothetical protein